MESTVVEISIPPPSFKHVSLSLSRSLLSKTPKQVFFNPINILNSFTTLYLLFYNLLFSFNVNIFIYRFDHMFLGKLCIFIHFMRY